MKTTKRKERNNFFMECKMNIKSNPKNIDRVLIKIMLNTIVPLGYSYRHNEKTKEGVIQFNKDVKIGENKYSLYCEAMKALISHSNVVEVKPEIIRLSPVVYVTNSLEPYSYIQADISLESLDECGTNHEWVALRNTEDKSGDVTIERVCTYCGKRNVETYDNRKY